MEVQGTTHSLTQRHKEEAMEHFILSAQPILSSSLGAQNCIQASRVSLAVLDAFGISAQAVPVKLMAGLPHKDLSLTLGSSPDEVAATGVRLLPQALDERGWMGHLVVVPDNRMQGQRWIIDPSFEQVIDQLNKAGAGITWTAMVQPIPLGPTFDRKEPQRYVLNLPNDVPLLLEYSVTKDNSYRREKGWGDASNRPLAATIIRTVQERLGITT